MGGRSAGPAARVLVVAATHGNERNAAWLLEQWSRRPELLASAGLPLELVIGNPPAYAQNRRYLDRDLNRSFEPSLLADPTRQEREIQRARELLVAHGPQGQAPCAVAIDLHSTTSAMGNSLVVYGRRPADLALAAGIQARLGLPVYLHEADAAQTGFLVERWPAGLVIEVGPVPQGLITARIARQSQLALEAACATLAAARDRCLQLPAGLTLHVHHGSLDLPRDAAAGPGGHGQRPSSTLHPLRQGRDWWPLAPGDPLFWSLDGGVQLFDPAAAAAVEARPAPGARWPVFINEAAYGEKGIALSLTHRERLVCDPGWGEALTALMAA
ncbi:aspartoacylase [Vulcanococcus limneticus]|uniref:aspartoacylase n=1 Tax=Vulcanococcus limneticus TaxID=2170428 RepID=UPI001E47A501|nr:aspartoacylase [Vulcanococcus limneticus]